MDNAFLGYMIEQSGGFNNRPSSENEIIEAIINRVRQGASIEQIYEEFDYVHKDSIDELIEMICF